MPKEVRNYKGDVDVFPPIVLMCRQRLGQGEVDQFKISPAVLQQLLQETSCIFITVGFNIEREVFTSRRNMHVYSLVVLDHSCSEMVKLRYNDHPGNPKSEFGLLLARQGEGATVLGRSTSSLN